ncbi:hypothetical protein SETIT_4G157700v2 [Setaria italica]|uniref:Uncharacterized protein n=1 Tax=Setaria italica TaxID=4555 RepID=K3Y0D7_SETIT|nr:hypothetical protein SETIT_4G157700v2 [Setaria italica]
MSRWSHRRVPSVIPENIAILDFKEEEERENNPAGEKKSSKEDTQSVSNEIKFQSPKELSNDKKVNNKSGLGDGKDGLKDLLGQVKTDKDN